MQKRISHLFFYNFSLFIGILYLMKHCNYNPLGMIF